MLSKLKFISDLALYEKEPPYEIFGPDTPISERINNCQYTWVDDVPISDVRTLKDEVFDMDGAGLEFIKHTSNVSLKAEYFALDGDSFNELHVSSYLEETMALIKSHVGAEKVIGYNWVFRRSREERESISPPRDTLPYWQQRTLNPALSMHCDYSHDGGEELIKLHLQKEELEKVNSGEWKAFIVSAWRPCDVVSNTPLVFADRRSVKCEDLLQLTKIFPDSVYKAFFLKYRPYHQWFYLSNQTPDEIALFKVWSSTADGKCASSTPHGAATYFSPNQSKARESVEMRMIVLKHD